MRSTSEGYERPTASSALGTSEHFKWLLGIVKVILVLNLIDAMFTLLWIFAGFARESNPLLTELISDYPVMFAIVKLALVSLGSVLLWRYRYRPLAIISIFIAFMIYYCLMLYHIAFFSRLLRAFFSS